jgi:hypothetical protein
MPVGCFVTVYLDDSVLNPGNPTPPFDANTFVTDQVESLEFFAGAAETPMRYSTSNAPCGVLVIHTRQL